MIDASEDWFVYRLECVEFLFVVCINLKKLEKKRIVNQRTVILMIGCIIQIRSRMSGSI
jgi:hypothetical protein